MDQIILLSIFWKLNSNKIEPVPNFRDKKNNLPHKFTQME